MLIALFALPIHGQEVETDSVYVYVHPVDSTTLTPLPQETHQELIQELDYNGKAREEELIEDEELKSDNAFLEWLKDLFDFDFGPIQLGPTGNIIVLLLLATGLGYFIYTFLEMPERYRSKAETEAGRVDITEIEEDKLTLAETESLLDRAVRNEQFDLAIRLQYLALLKRLHDMKMIRFAKDKVNLLYIREMDRIPVLAAPFRHITHNFERNWYGRYPIDRLTYKLVAETYADFNSKLDAHLKATAVE